MKEIHIFLPGQPIGKGRPRFTRMGRVYTPAKTKNYEMKLAAAGSDVMIQNQLDPIQCPCKVLIKAQFEIPKSWTKKKKAQAAALEINPGKPDIDNVAKIALDALNGVAFEDDQQVYDLKVIKRYGDPCLIITVSY
jgi:Holliday junction resolvase RusA-like endonuclease